MEQSSDTTQQSLTKEKDRLRQLYLRQNRLRFSGILVARAILTIISTVAFAAFLTVIIGKAFEGFISTRLLSHLLDVLAFGSGVGVMFWVGRWDDTKRYQRFLNSLEAEQIADGKTPEAPQPPH